MYNQKQRWDDEGDEGDEFHPQHGVLTSLTDVS